MDTDNHRYLVSFDRPGIGKHAVADIEVRVRTEGGKGGAWSSNIPLAVGAWSSNTPLVVYRRLEFQV